MIFIEAHAQQMIDRSKWQTRRPVKPGEYATVIDGEGKTWAWNPKFGGPFQDDWTILAVRHRDGQIKWQVDKDYAVQTGRGKKSIGRTPSVEAIRRERLQEISDDDCLAEGIQCRFNRIENAFRFYNVIDPAPYHIGVSAFRGLWGHFYRKPYDWASNPECWVLVFERVGETGEE